MKTIALFDSYRGGHHLTYLRIFSQTLLNLGYQVMAFYPDYKDIREWVIRHCPAEYQNFHSFKIRNEDPPKYPIIGRLPQPLATLERWQYAAQIIQQSSAQIQALPDLVFFNWIDSYFSYYLTHHLVDRVFPYNWSGLYFQPGDLRYEQHVIPLLGIPLSHYGVVNSRHCRGLAILDETLTHNLQAKVKNPVIAFPDITDESSPDFGYSLVRDIQEKAQGRKIVGLIGSLNKRKGLLTLLESAEKVKDENLFFVFAGNYSQYGMSEEEKQKVQYWLDSAPENCFFHFQYIPDEPQFNALIVSCNILFAAYENFPYSSNILTKAAVFKKPVIVSEGFCMGKRVEKYKLGITIPEGNVAKCIEALRYLESELDANSSQFQPDFENYHKVHSLESLKTALKVLLTPKI